MARKWRPSNSSWQTQLTLERIHTLPEMSEMEFVTKKRFFARGIRTLEAKRDGNSIGKERSAHDWKVDHRIAAGLEPKKKRRNVVGATCTPSKRSPFHSTWPHRVICHWLTWVHQRRKFSATSSGRRFLRSEKKKKLKNKKRRTWIDSSWLDLFGGLWGRVSCGSHVCNSCFASSVLVLQHINPISQRRITRISSASGRNCQPTYLFWKMIRSWTLTW